MATITDTGSSLDFDWPNDYYNDFLSLPYGSVESFTKENDDKVLRVKFTADRFDVIEIIYADITAPVSANIDDLISQLNDIIQIGTGANDKGYFATPVALTTAHPTGQDGWYATVGTTDTVWVWDGDTTAWVDSGGTAVVPATEAVAGIAELATQAEADAGTDDLRILTPLKAKNTRGIEAFFLEAKGSFGTGAGWADEGFISLYPNLLFAASATERAIYMFYALARTKFDNIDPQVAFLISSTGAPAAAEAIRWQLTCRYRADGEVLGGAASQTLLQTQVLATLVADSRQTPLIFTLDRSLIADQDSLHFNLERLGGDAADTYGSDIGVGQSGIIVESLNHNP